MTSIDQLARVRKLVLRETTAAGDKPALAGWLQRVCRTAARDLPAMGVGISIQSAGSAQAVGAARLGAMDVYRDRAGALTAQTLVSAMTFAEVAMEGLLTDAGAGKPGAPDLFDDIDGNRFEVYQAQGMLMAQLGVGAEQALIRLRAYAYAHEQPAVDVARDIIARKIILEENDQA